MRAIAVICLLVLSPAASAWSSMGGVEPSTPDDDPVYMWQEGPGGAGQLYFNVVSRVGTESAGVNPNVAALSTRIEPFAVVHHEAVLGVWRDCNGDGYVGMAETGVREYAAALLLDTAACPPIEGSPERFPPFAHNYRGWVSELIPVVRKAGDDRRVLVDREVMVWGDHGRPEPTGPATSWAVPSGLPDAEGNLPEVVPPPPKARADWNFNFSSGARGAFPGSVVLPGRAGGADATFGVGPGGARWYADGVVVKLPRTLRGDPVRGTADTDGAAWFTFYAAVGAATFATGARPPGGQGFYGAAFCPGVTTGAPNGWECDASRWYRYPDGTPVPEPHTLARVGALYQLRDVDCQDGGVAAGRAGAGVAYYSEAPCL